jgi:hypothetical protein
MGAIAAEHPEGSFGGNDSGNDFPPAALRLTGYSGGVLCQSHAFFALDREKMGHSDFLGRVFSSARVDFGHEKSECPLFASNAVPR